MLGHVDVLIKHATRGIALAEIDTTVSVLKRMIDNLSSD